MNQQILNFLNKINDPLTVNRLLVSTFLKHKNKSIVKNNKINKLVIQKSEILYKELQKFTDILDKHQQRLCFEQLLELFEFVISPSDKLVNGAIYTPDNIRKYITKESFELIENKNLDNIKIADIACGCGGFLIDATKELKSKTNKTYKDIYRDNIYGIDIQPYSANRTKILLILLAITEGEDEEKFEFNIYVGDTLEYDWRGTKFDMILGNPPYVCSRNMDDNTKKLMKNWSTCRTGHPDLYIPFFQIGYELLHNNGVLGYITVNSFINSVNGRAIREYFEKNNVTITLIDFKDEQVFISRMTYTCLCFLEKDKKPSVSYIQDNSKQLKSLNKYNFINIEYKNIDSFLGWSLKDNDFIKRIELRGTPFCEIYDTKSGIATLKNHIYIFKPLKENDKYYYLDESTMIEKEICKGIVNSNKLDKYEIFDDLVEKIIFPYKHNKEGKAELIDEKDFKEKYPNAYAYLKSNKDLLLTRDKGKGKYMAWYAFGRSQSLEKRKYKLLFPQLVRRGFKTIYSDDENLYFYNGMCAYASKQELLKLQEIMKTDEFWKYVKCKAKPYASGYYGLGKNYLKNFGIKYETN